MNSIPDGPAVTDSGVVYAGVADTGMASPGVAGTARQHEGLIGLGQCREGGMSDDDVRALVAHDAWRRVARGVYDTTPHAELDLDARRRRAAWLGLLALGPDAVSVGCCALALHGVAGLPRTLEPEVAMADGRCVRGPAGVRVRRYRNLDGAVEVAGWSVSDIPTALGHALPMLSRLNAVAVLDSALNTGRIDEGQLREVRAGLRGRRGCRGLADVWHVVDGLAESPLESWARLECVDAGIPPDRLQAEIRDETGAFVARVDMLWFRADGSVVVAEIDGQGVHREPQALYGDRSRQNRLLSLSGVTVLRFTIRDLEQPGAVARSVREALAAG